MTGKSTAPVDITPAGLSKVKPFKRRKLMNVEGYIAALEAEVFGPPAEQAAQAEHAGLYLFKLMQLTIAHRDDAQIEAFFERLKPRLPTQTFERLYYRGLVTQRRFTKASQIAEAAWRADPDDYRKFIEHVRTLFLAGDSAPALELLEQKLTTDLTRLQQRDVATLLVEAGKVDMVAQAYPDLAATLTTLRWGIALDKPLEPLVRAYCISLERDRQRMQTSRVMLSEGVDLIDVTGVPGNTLPKAISLATNSAAGLTPGEVGCSLSHLKCWERIAAECGPNEYALVLEDDSRFLYGAARGLDHIVAAARRRQAGLVFVNTRSRAHLPWPQDPSEIDVMSLPEYHEQIGKGLRRSNPGWGTDGYILNGATAAALAENWLKIGMCGAIDWQLYLLCFHDIRDSSHNRFYRIMRKRLIARRVETPFRLDGYVTNFPIIRTRDYGYSTINAG